MNTEEITEMEFTETFDIYREDGRLVCGNRASTWSTKNDATFGLGLPWLWDKSKAVHVGNARVEKRTVPHSFPAIVHAVYTIDGVTKEYTPSDDDEGEDTGLRLASAVFF